MTDTERRTAIILNVLRQLADERERQGLSRNALAAKAGLSQPMISRLEGGIAINPTFESMLRISKALNLDLGALITRATTAEADGT